MCKLFGSVLSNESVIRCLPSDRSVEVGRLHTPRHERPTNLWPHRTEHALGKGPASPIFWRVENPGDTCYRSPLAKHILVIYTPRTVGSFLIGRYHVTPRVSSLDQAICYVSIVSAGRDSLAAGPTKGAAERTTRGVSCSETPGTIDGVYPRIARRDRGDAPHQTSFIHQRRPQAFPIVNHNTPLWNIRSAHATASPVYLRRWTRPCLKFAAYRNGALRSEQKYNGMGRPNGPYFDTNGGLLSVLRSVPCAQQQIVGALLLHLYIQQWRWMVFFSQKGCM